MDYCPCKFPEDTERIWRGPSYALPVDEFMAAPRMQCCP